MWLWVFFASKIFGFILTLLSLAHIFYYYFSSWSKELNKFPGPRFIPLLGNLRAFLFIKTQDAFSKPGWFWSYGTERVWMGWRAFIMTTDLDVVQKILSSPNCTDKAYELGDVLHTTFTETSIVVGKREFWKPRRKLLLPGITNTSMNSDYLSVFHVQLQYLMEALEKDRLNSGEFHVREMMEKYLLGASLENVAGWEKSVNILKDELPGFYEAHRRNIFVGFLPALEPFYSYSIPWRLSGYAREFQMINKVMAKYFSKEFISRKMAEWKAASKDKSSAGPMKYGEILYCHWTDEKEIYSQLIQVLSAAVDSAGSVLCCALCIIAMQPQVQQKLYEEAKEVFGDDDRVPTVDEIERLPYMELVLKEVMRLYPPAPALGRNMGVDLDIGGGLSIPKDTSVFINVQMIQRNPDIWPNPDEFIPERFLRKEVAKRHPFSYLPFSKGPRNCFGKKHAMMEMKLTLAKILITYELTSKMDQDVSRIPMEYSPTPRVKGGLVLGLKLRK